MNKEQGTKQKENWLNKKRNQIIFVAIAVCLLVNGALIMNSYRTTSPYIQYEGTETFVSDEEYADFMNYIMTEEDIHILSVEHIPSVWAKYKISLPRTSIFPFEYSGKSPQGSITVVVVFAVLLAVGVLMLSGAIAFLVHHKKDDV